MTKAGAICLALAVLARAARRQHIDVVSFAYLFALTGATDLLVTKITLQLIRLQVMHVKRWERAPGGTTSALTALMLTLHVTIFFFQVMSVNYTKALQSVPLFMGSGAIMQISLCGVFFQEFNFTTVQAVVFFLGFGFVLTGLVVTSQASSQGHEQADKKPDKGAAGPAIVPIDGPPSKPEALAVADSPAMFVPPTAPGATDRPVISGGLLARSDSLFNSADFLLASELQRSAMVFGGNKPADEHFARKFPSFQSSLTPRLASGQMASPLLEEGSGEGRPTSWQKDPRKWRSYVSDGGRTGGRT
uniref:EamA domain-containing protein n=1 Tax=Zooxanthella nutricula TaxID=1333877 RepID=A0A7S2KHU3_9DINO|mmetsp:Transcript_48200/g.146574  ORF Transcript_48200/g.146574 Transcript_48200/m.146574 type:complete len:304 (+) Transcript_48200:1-912(+)